MLCNLCMLKILVFTSPILSKNLAIISHKIRVTFATVKSLKTLDFATFLGIFLSKIATKKSMILFLNCHTSILLFTFKKPHLFFSFFYHLPQEILMIIVPLLLKIIWFLLILLHDIFECSSFFPHEISSIYFFLPQLLEPFLNSMPHLLFPFR